MGFELVTPSVYFTLECQWGTYPRLDRQWITSVVRAGTGMEQRSSLISTVRYGMEFDIETKDYEQTSWLLKNVMKNAGAVWGMPIWPYKTNLVAVLSAGQSAVQVEDTTGREFTTGQEVIIIQSLSKWEVFTLQTVTVGYGMGGSVEYYLNAAASLSQGFTRSAKVFPVFPADVEIETGPVGYDSAVATVRAMHTKRSELST